MSSKRGGNPRREAAWWGRCCTGGKCSRAGQESNGDLLQDDASLTPGVGIGGEAEGEREPRTDVQLGVGTGHTAQHNHTHTQEGGYGKADRNVHHGVGEHHGEGGYARPTGASNLTTALNLSNSINQEGSGGATLEAGKANDGEKGQAAGGKRAVVQGEEEPERRLCGGCQMSET